MLYCNLIYKVVSIVLLMITQFKRFFSFKIFFWLSYCICAAFYLTLLYRYDWYADFYQHLVKKDIKSYRMLQIWVQGDKLAWGDASPIGGDEKDFEEWKKAMNLFLLKAHEHRSLATVTVELVLDYPTQQLHQSLLEEWQQHYPSCLIVTPIEAIIDHYPSLKTSLAQCTQGIPAVCSDILRVWHLRQPFDVNIYIDVDTFIYRAKNQYNPFVFNKEDDLPSHKAWGLNLSEKGVYTGFLLDREKGNIVSNNDMIIDFFDQDSWIVIKAVAENHLNRYQDFLTFITERSLLLDCDFYTYEAYLLKKIEWAKKNPTLNFNQVPMIIGLVGPAFWRMHQLEGWVKPYYLPSMPSSGLWMNRLSSVYGATSQAMLQQLYNESVIDHILSITFMAHDYYYLKDKNVRWLDQLETALIDEWNVLSEHEQSLASDLLRSPMEWAKELAEHAKNN